MDPEGLFPNEPQLPSGPIMNMTLPPLPPGSLAQRIQNKKPCTCTPKGDPPVMNGLCLLTAGVVGKTAVYVGSNYGIGKGANWANKGLTAIGAQGLTPAVNATANILKSPALGAVLFVTVGAPEIQEMCRAVPVCQD